MDYDGAALRAPRQVFELTPRLASPIVATQLANANYLALSETSLARGNVNPYYVNNSIWEAAIYGNVTAESRVKLDSFFLFEWFPRSPGRYFTAAGIEARREAQGNIDSAANGVVVYNPHGKSSMLEGGVGNIRLKPVTITGVERYLMSASSSGNCHEGFPVAIMPGDYNKYIQEIRDRGAAVVDLYGVLKYVPTSLEEIYRDYAGVPQLCLVVEEVHPASNPKSRSMEELSVSVAISFHGEFEGRQGVYASYVNFDPSKQASFDRHVDWMKNEYVPKYNGKIITDFDQQVTRFPGARFSLDKVMKLEVQKQDFAVLSQGNIDINRVLAGQQKIQVIVAERVIMTQGGSYMEKNYTFNDKVDVGVMDNSGTINGSVSGSGDIVQGPAADKPLDVQLKLLREAMLTRSPDAEQSTAIGAVAEAETATQQGKPPTALSRLQKTGTWVIGIAEEIGAKLAVEAIKHQLGWS